MPPRSSPITISAASPSAIKRAAGALRAGQLVAFPTETVYGLGGDATSDDAVAAIYAAKARPHFNPLIIHVPTLRAARRLAWFDARALRLARAFWPGPLTLVLKRRVDCPVSWLASAGLDTLAIRIPDHRTALALLRAARIPLAAPSANRSGRISPTQASHVAGSFRRQKKALPIAMILDGGRCGVGLESTVVDMSGKKPVILRPGGVTREEVEAVIGRIANAATGEIRSPGQLKSHYAPRLKLRLNARAPTKGEAFLAFGRTPRSAAANATLNLSPSRDLREAAANLFTMLRSLDRPRFTRIAVAPVPKRGLGAAINDRLMRAAAPRR